MNIFKLAYKQLQRERKHHDRDVYNLVLDRAVKIRKYLDMQVRNKKVARQRNK